MRIRRSAATIAPLLALALGLPQPEPAAAQVGMPWTRSPQVVVIGASPADVRFALVDEAVAFWNRQLREAGSPFRLGAPTRLVRPPPEADLQERSRQVLEGRARTDNVPVSLRDLPGDLRVVLGDSGFVSFAGPTDDSGRRVVGIRTAASPPLSLPNVAVNLIAHELGHAIGLAHNADVTALMCGRPAPCRPDDYQSAASRMFPLLPSDVAALLRLYPPSWQPRPD